MNAHDGMERELMQRLGALREAMKNERAPERVRAAVLEAYRRHPPRPARAWWRQWGFAAAAAVAAIAVITTVAGFWPAGRERRAPAVAEVSRPPFVEETRAAGPSPPAAARQSVLRGAAVEPAAEAAVPFIPLVPDLAWMPGEGAQVLRVTMPRTALQSFGLPVDENVAFDTVRADIVVGQDMVARAIRLVR